MSENETREIVNCVRTLLKTRGYIITKKEISALIEGRDFTDPVVLADAVVTALSNPTATMAAARRGKIPTVRREVESFVRSLPSDLPGSDVALKILARYIVKPKQKDEDLSVWKERISAQINAWSSPEVEAEVATGDVTTDSVTEIETAAVSTEYNF